MRCTPRWCNKPKFHIILHLVEHIRLFGPATLYATEKFESCNALIRDLSVHSNRQAPSRDIGKGFAHANRIRHLTSGGKFIFKQTHNSSGLLQDSSVASIAPEDKADAGNYRSIGRAVVDLVENDETLRKFCAFPPSVSVLRGAQIIIFSL